MYEYLFYRVHLWFIYIWREKENLIFQFRITYTWIHTSMMSSHSITISWKIWFIWDQDHISTYARKQAHMMSVQLKVHMSEDERRTFLLCQNIAISIWMRNLYIFMIFLFLHAKQHHNHNHRLNTHSIILSLSYIHFLRLLTIWNKRATTTSSSWWSRVGSGLTVAVIVEWLTNHNWF